MHLTIFWQPYIYPREPLHKQNTCSGLGRTVRGQFAKNMTCTKHYKCGLSQKYVGERKQHKNSKQVNK